MPHPASLRIFMVNRPLIMLEIIRGFAATAPAAVLEAVSALSEAFRPWIEEDQIVTIYDDMATSGGE